MNTKNNNENENMLPIIGLIKSLHNQGQINYYSKDSKIGIRNGSMLGINPIDTPLIALALHNCFIELNEYAEKFSEINQSFSCPNIENKFSFEQLKSASKILSNILSIKVLQDGVGLFPFEKIEFTK